MEILNKTKLKQKLETMGYFLDEELIWRAIYETGLYPASHFVRGNRFFVEYGRNKNGEVDEIVFELEKPAVYKVQDQNENERETTLAEMSEDEDIVEKVFDDVFKFIE